MTEQSKQAMANSLSLQPPALGSPYQGVVEEHFRKRTPFTQLLIRRGLVKTGFDGLSKMTLEYESEDATPDAVIDMDGYGKTDRPLKRIESLPLPITHADVDPSALQLTPGMGKCYPKLEAAARRVGDAVERTLFQGYDPNPNALGTLQKIQGLTTYPDRITYIYDNDEHGYPASPLVYEIDKMLTVMERQGFFGPFALVYGQEMDKPLDCDAQQVMGLTFKGNPITVRDQSQKLQRGEGENVRSPVEEVAFSNYLADYDLVLVQLTADVVRIVEGMPVKAVRWNNGETIKVMTITVPQIRSGPENRCGVIHASPARVKS